MPKELWWFAHPLCTLDQAGWFIAFKFLALGFERNNDRDNPVAANKLKIKTDAKCDLGSSHCYLPIFPPGISVKGSSDGGAMVVAAFDSIVRSTIPVICQPRKNNAPNNSNRNCQVTCRWDLSLLDSIACFIPMVAAAIASG